MPITSWATFTMKRGKEAAALKLVQAVKRQAQNEQPGTLVYLFHRENNKDGTPGRTLFFYESYRNKKALDAHLASSSWQAVRAHWTECFEGPNADKGVTFGGLTRMAAFARAGAIPVKAPKR